MDPTEQQINDMFTYHAPTQGQIERMQEIRERFRNLALLLHYNCPKSRELSLALTKLQEANMMANAAIAIHEKASGSQNIGESSTTVNKAYGVDLPQGFTYKD